MKYLVTSDDDRVAEWICQRIPMFEYGSTPYTCIGLANRLGGLIAGAIYENFTQIDIRMHVVIEGGINRHWLGEIFRYPFLGLGVRRVTGLVPARNVAAQRLDEHVGFKLEGRMRSMLPDGDDLLIYGLLKEECRFLNVGLRRGIPVKSKSAA